MRRGTDLKFENFKKAFEEIAEQSNLEEMHPVIKIDAQITSKNINKETVKQLEMMEPFGESSKMPVFVYKGLKIDSIRSLSDGKHLKLTLKDENMWLDAIGFNMGKLAEEYLIGDKIDVVCSIELNTFNNKEKVQINLKDIRKSF